MYEYSDWRDGGSTAADADAVDDVALAAVVAAVERLAADDAGCSGDAVVLARLEGVGRAIDRLEAVRARLLAGAERSGALERDGAATAAAWLRRHSSLASAQASTRTRIARRLGELPVIAAAFADGRLGVAHVSAIEGLCRDVGVEPVADVQDELVQVAGRLRTVDEFTRLCRGWRHALRPDAADADDDAAYARRRVTLNAVGDGVCYLNGVLDAESGATLAAALTAFMTHDPPGTPAELRRDVGQRRADALMDIARRALGDADAPNVAGAKPRVVVRVTGRDLIALCELVSDPAHPDHRRLPGHRGLDAAAPAGSAPTVDWVGPVGLSLVRRLLSDASVIRVVFDSDGRPVDVGTATRVWPAAVRAAITERDRGCRFDPCDRPAAWCDIDHVVPWPKGPTSVDNGILLCRHHHRAKRRDGWWPALHADGTVAWTHADGRTRTDPAPAVIDRHVETLLGAAANRAPGARSDHGAAHHGAAHHGVMCTAGGHCTGDVVAVYDAGRPPRRDRQHARCYGPPPGVTGEPAPAYHIGRVPPGAHAVASAGAHAVAPAGAQTVARARGDPRDRRHWHGGPRAAHLRAA